MGFIFGLIIGSMATSSGAMPPILGSIPFRCLAAFEISDAEYRQCRDGTLRKEIYSTMPCTWRETEDVKSPCSYEKAVTWEIAGLHELKRAAEQRQSTR